MALENQLFNEGDEQKRIAKSLPAVFLSGARSSQIQVAAIVHQRGGSWISL
jgi:hypothetical protein